MRSQILLCFRILFLFLLPTTTIAFSTHPKFRARRKQPCASSQLAVTDKHEIGIGIDLGTTHSAVAYLKDGIPTIIEVPNNGRTMPSVVSYIDAQTVLVGGPAIEQEVDHGAYRNVKRILGTGGKLDVGTKDVVPFLSPCSEGKTFKKSNMNNKLHDATEYPTMLTSSLNPNETLHPEEVSAHILRTLREVAENHTGCVVTRAVLGIPAYFNDAQRDATLKAAELAGIRKTKLLREPEAAALAYAIGKEQVGRGDDDELVLVFDLGGGTFDVSMLVVGGGVTEIISTSGNAQLGGSDFDNRIAQYFLKLLRGHGISTKKWSVTAINAVVRSAEKVRIFLSNNKKATLALPVAEELWIRLSHSSQILHLATTDCAATDAGTSNATHLLCDFTRKEMESLCRDEFQQLIRPVREVAIISGALLPGDASPTLVEAAFELEEELKSPLEFDDFYSEVLEVDNSDLLIEIEALNMKDIKRKQQQGRKRARDVAKQERMYREEKRKVDESNRRSESERMKVRDGISGRPISRVVLVGGATRMPCIGRLLSVLTGIVPQKTVNPDEAVALGCAVHVGVLDGTEGMGTVLNPMQAAILRAVAQQQGMYNDNVFGDDEDDFQ
jgi:molecular chaperone DnaK (HSP70)